MSVDDWTEPRPNAGRSSASPQPGTTRERIAAALSTGRGGRPWGMLTPNQRAFYLADADAVIAALGEVDAAALRAALADAVEGMREMIEFVPATFRRRGQHDEYLARAIAALGGDG